jgi:hypothetical protein
MKKSVTLAGANIKIIDKTVDPISAYVVITNLSDANVFLYPDEPAVDGEGLVISPGGSITMAFNGNVYGKGASFQ